MARPTQMLTFMVLLAGLITQCTEDQVGTDGGDGGDDGQPTAGGSAGDTESSGGDLPMAGHGADAMGGAPQGDAGNASGARPGEAGNGGASSPGDGGTGNGGTGNGGTGDGATGDGGDGGSIRSECSRWNDDEWDPNVSCCLVCVAGEPCRAPKCGNGTVENDCLIPYACYARFPGVGVFGPLHYEECDDGNLVDGDGCSSSCGFETDLTCGNGQLDANEVCDDGNTEAGDGCDPLCRQKLSSYHCDVPGEPCELDVCGNGRSGIGLCDDGNTEAGDGCDAECHREPGFTCPAEGACIAGFACPEESECVEAFCGNGSIDLYVLDDSDGAAGADGTGSSQLSHREQCDDGNKVSGDGCNSSCRAEAGWTCSVPGDACRHPECGDGYLLPPTEECDDGNNESGDGCSDACETESGWVCTAGDAGVTCTVSRCGDGVLDADSGEDCDDGNDDSDDGCSSECEVEGTLCTGLTESPP